ncbi:unnamed protein product [Peniophora sp. CBMAI 1063]|nr:unnamed protein product [Peniophora sp. CBMAI 1063]
MSIESQKMLVYLGLSPDYDPAPDVKPIQFLSIHLHELPASLLIQFTDLLSPRQRSVIPAIRNRRLKYTQGNPVELRFTEARRTWPTLWEGRERRGVEEGADERAWADTDFLEGSQRPHVGKLGKMLGELEEEREAERVRTIRREQATAEEFIPEEDEDEDESEDDTPPPDNATPPDPQADMELFSRRVRERFIYGLLDTQLYDKVDWDDGLDEVDREAEERWFDEDD